MATKDITIRTIALSEETAELLNCKRMLDECFNKLGDTHDRLLAHDEQFDGRLGKAYVAINELIVNLLAENIDNKSTESHYKVI